MIIYLAVDLREKKVETLQKGKHQEVLLSFEFLQDDKPANKHFERMCREGIANDHLPGPQPE